MNYAGLSVLNGRYQIVKVPSAASWNSTAKRGPSCAQRLRSLKNSLHRNTYGRAEAKAGQLRAQPGLPFFGGGGGRWELGWFGCAHAHTRRITQKGGGVRADGP